MGARQQEQVEQIQRGEQDRGIEGFRKERGEERMCTQVPPRLITLAGKILRRE